MPEIRLRRIESLLRSEISSMILTGQIKDPRIEPLTTITEVKITKDLGHAKVWVSRFGDRETSQRERGCAEPRGGVHPGRPRKENLPARLSAPALSTVTMPWKMVSAWRQKLRDLQS